MAGDWIPMRTNLAADPRVLTIAEKLGVEDVDLVVGKLHRLWSYADEHASVTQPSRMSVTPTLLDRILVTPGFAEALENVGWLEVENGQVVLPRLEEYISRTAKQRALSARRSRKYRESGGNGGNDSVTQASRSPSRPSSRKRHAGASRASRKVRDQHDTTRDSIYDGVQGARARDGADGGEGLSPSLRQIADHIAGHEIFSRVLNPDEITVRLARQFPELDLLDTLEKAETYLAAEPAKREELRTIRNPGRFLFRFCEIEAREAHRESSRSTGRSPDRNLTAAEKTQEAIRAVLGEENVA